MRTCDVDDLRGMGEGPWTVPPNGSCRLPAGHASQFHSQDPDGDGGYALLLGGRRYMTIPRGVACPVFRTLSLPSDNLAAT